MQDVNEAWRVLRDPASRAAYDAGLRRPERVPVPARSPASGPTAPTGPDEPVVRVIRGLPWIAAAVVLGAIFVFTAFAGGTSDRGPSPSDWVGKCVASAGGTRIQEVGCGSTGASRVDLVVQRASQCANGSSATPLDDAWLCLRPVRD
jgi:hypothetical protein